MSGAGHGDAERRGRGDAATRRHGDESCRSDVHVRAAYNGSLSPADKVVISYLTIIAALVAISNGRVGGWWWFVTAHALAITAVAVGARIGAHVPRRVAASPRLPVPASPRPRFASPRSRVSPFIRAWYPVALIPFTYKELEYLIPRVHPRDFDWQLAAIDRWLFGVHPTVWLERVTWPPLTELFQLSYITYYILPLALGVVVWRKGWFDKFHFLVFVIVLSFYVSYLGYIAVPAIGPRFILAGEQSFPLKGLLAVDWIRATLDRAEGITRDCFPSGHVMLTLVVLYYARKFHRPTFWWSLPAGSALIIATVYLRYHYVIDVFAGVMLAAGVVAVADSLYATLGGMANRRVNSSSGQ